MKGSNFEQPQWGGGYNDGGGGGGGGRGGGGNYRGKVIFLDMLTDKQVYIMNFLKVPNDWFLVYMRFQVCSSERPTHLPRGHI